MKKHFDILRKCTLFNQIADENIIPMLKCLDAKVETYEKKYTIMAEGSPAKYIGIVLSGSARIVQIDYYGNRSILSTVSEADMFAEAFACAQISEIPVSVIANEHCEIMHINCNRIMHTCSNACGFHQQLIFNLMKNLATKNIMFYTKAEITSKRKTREKLLAYLKMQAKDHNSDSFYIPFDRQELADFLEVDRSGLSSEISKLREEGVIESRKNHFKLL